MKRTWIKITMLLGCLGMGCGDDFDEVKRLRQVTLEVQDLGNLALPASQFDQPLRLSSAAHFTVPEDLGRGGSITLLAQPNESYTQEHLFTSVDESESNNSVATAQPLGDTVVQVIGGVNDGDPSTTLDNTTFEDFYLQPQTATGNRVALLLGDLVNADFEISVYDDTGSTVLGDSQSDEDGSSNEMEIAKYTVSTPNQNVLFAVSKDSTDTTNVAYWLTNQELALEAEPNNEGSQAQAINASSTSFRAIEGAAASSDTGTTVSISGENKTIEDFYTLTLTRNSIVSFALKLTTTPLTNTDLNLYVVRADNGELLGSSEIDQTSSSSTNVESFFALVPADVEVRILVDALSGTSNYLAAAQVLSAEVEAKPIIIFGGLTDPANNNLFDLTEACFEDGYLSNDCAAADDKIFVKFEELSNAFNKLFGRDVLSLTLPGNNSQFPLSEEKMPAGSYAYSLTGAYEEIVTVDSSHTLDTSVKALIKRDGDPGYGVLNINLYFVGQTVIDAATSTEGEAIVTDIFARVTNIYDQIGIELGEINRINLSGTAADALGSGFDIGSSEDLETLLGLIERRDGYLNVFLIDSFNSAGLLGVSLGISGLPVVDGVPTSGAIFAMGTPLAELVDLEIDLLMSTFAHEMGHYMGLYHPSEASGLTFDPLSDTAECGLNSDENGDSVVSYSECEDAGALNLMFWSAPDTLEGYSRLDQAELTPQQGFVLNTNHYVR